MARKWDGRLPFPSVKRLAAEMGLSVSQVRARLSTVEKKGFVKRVPRKGRSNQYDPSALITRLENAIDEYERGLAAGEEEVEMDPIDAEAIF